MYWIEESTFRRPSQWLGARGIVPPLVAPLHTNKTQKCNCTKFHGLRLHSKAITTQQGWTQPLPACLTQMWCLHRLENLIGLTWKWQRTVHHEMLLRSKNPEMLVSRNTFRYAKVTTSRITNRWKLLYVIVQTSQTLRCVTAAQPMRLIVNAQATTYL